MILFVGLGNPGREHSRNRHNVGFMVIERIAAHYGFPESRKRFGGLLQEHRIDGEKLLLFRPLSFMNRSGEPVFQVKEFFRILPEQIVVFHDELDLAPGKLRVKTGGGTAGHNGLRSLVGTVGEGFRRVRIGVGKPVGEAKEGRVLSHVLGDFSKRDGDWLEPLLDAITSNMPLLLQGLDDAFASKVMSSRMVN